jgi:hypothetical protein
MAYGSQMQKKRPLELLVVLGPSWCPPMMLSQSFHSVSYTTAVCIKAHTFCRFLLYSFVNMEIIERLMRADKDLFIGTIFLSAK